MSAPLSARERETLLYIADGCTYRQAARRMGISVHTVDTYIQRVRAKSGASTIADLVWLALASGHAKIWVSGPFTPD
jgi:DNA-binding CsgD family transcriptional regulator